MGISTAAHLPFVTSTTYPALTSHLLAAYSARKVGQWTVNVRVLRSVPAVNVEGGDVQQLTTRTAKLMYVVQMNEFPDDTFVLVEDPQCETRASIKSRHAFELVQRAAAEAVASQVAVAVNGGSGLTDGNKDAAAAATMPFDSTQQLDTIDGGSSNVGPGSDLLRESTKEDVDMTMDDQKKHDGTIDNPTSAANTAATSPPLIQPVQSTRLTLFVASSHFPMLLQRLNLPSPLGAPSSGDGNPASSTSAAAAASSAGPGAWLPRGLPITITGTVYDIPSAMGYGDEDAEWRVRLGMIQSGGGSSSRSAGAIVESEYLPVTHTDNDAFVTAYTQNLFPAIITAPSTAAALSMGGGKSGTTDGMMAAMPASVASSVPTSDQWQEVIPASNEAWMRDTGILPSSNENKSESVKELQNPSLVLPANAKDPIGWRGKERGRRLAYLYITLLRNQSVI